MSDDPVLNGQPISGLKVVELRKELECRGLSKSGVKKDLFERLRDHLNRVGPENDRPIDFEADDEPAAAPRPARASLSPRKGASPTKQPSPVMNKFVAQYLQNQQATLQEHRRGEVAPEVPPDGAAQPSSSSEEAAEVTSTTAPEVAKAAEKPKRSPKKEAEVPAPAAVPLDEVELAKKKGEIADEPTSSTPDAVGTTQPAKEEAAPVAPIAVESSEKPAEKPAVEAEPQIPPPSEQAEAVKKAAALHAEVEAEQKAEEPAESPKVAPEVPKTPEKSSPAKAKKAAESPVKSPVKAAAPIAHEISPPPVERPPPKPDSQPEPEDEKPAAVAVEAPAKEAEEPKKEEEPVRKRPKIVFDIDTKPAAPAAAKSAARSPPTTPATPTAEKAAASRRKITPPTAQSSSDSTVKVPAKPAAGLPPKTNERQNSVGMVQPRAPSPARHDPTEFLHISGLKRPYTIENLQSMLDQFGEYSHEEDFWVDKKLRSACIVKQEDPTNGSKKTSISEPSAAAGRLVIHVQNDRRSPPASVSRKRERSAERSRASQESDWDKSAATPPRKDYDLDNLFKKTTALPHIYYLPLTDEEAESRKAERATRNGGGDRAADSKPSTSRRRSPSPRRSPPRRRPLRSRSRTPLRDRRRSPPRRRVSRSRSPVRRRR
ncbi:Apoptotic chromatin condensation inducer in the nucleus [Aphelenchoides fujianensis]|nr:Apoptotic chromatin condensation inducer in the nucleus [Aphelenchoides fujianensis]